MSVIRLPKHEQKRQAQAQARALDKLHVNKMSQAMMGVAVAFAFDDEQGLRAAAWLIGHMRRQLKLEKKDVLDIVERGIDAVEQEPELVAKGDSRIVVPGDMQ